MLISSESTEKNQTNECFGYHVVTCSHLVLIARAKIDQVDATLFVEQRLNNVVIKVRQHLLN